MPREVASADITPVAVTSVATAPPVYSPEEDDLNLRDVPVSSARLPNSEMLCELRNNLSHLSEEQSTDIVMIVSRLVFRRSIIDQCTSP